MPTLPTLPKAPTAYQDIYEAAAQIRKAMEEAAVALRTGLSAVADRMTVSLTASRVIGLIDAGEPDEAMSLLCNLDVDQLQMIAGIADQLAVLSIGAIARISRDELARTGQ